MRFRALKFGFTSIDSYLQWKLKMWLIWYPVINAGYRYMRKQQRKAELWNNI